MPITRGIKCAYCGDMSSQSDYQMEIHLKQHTDEIDEARELNGKRDNKRRYKTISEY